MIKLKKRNTIQAQEDEDKAETPYLSGDNQSYGAETNPTFPANEPKRPKNPDTEDPTDEPNSPYREFIRDKYK